MTTALPSPARLTLVPLILLCVGSVLSTETHLAYGVKVMRVNTGCSRWSRHWHSLVKRAEANRFYFVQLDTSSPFIGEA
jgi:hypothetical protein